ncbi:lytic transglycosylase domain-containing protein [Novosphingobium malaysiense]|uniref:lytic transglycosylase domain-containing protein n=1 Tax=Novosphingobium malaysiense TaxID=1348853 RepID=UPI0006922A8C|nr:lytic transglycosylase domain-containing protein [Novosphingobium malaysiense]
MDPLRILAAGLALAMAGMAREGRAGEAADPAHAPPGGRWAAYVGEASSRFGIPAAWIARVIAAESAGRTELDGRPIVSRAGAMGLMQLMPGTWAAMREQLALGADPHDPRDNIMAGSGYLRRLYDRFGYPGLFAAYNAGPHRYRAYLATGRPLPGETRAYLAQLGVRLRARGQAAGAPSGAGAGAVIFFATGCGRNASKQAAGLAGGLFAYRRAGKAGTCPESDPSPGKDQAQTAAGERVSEAAR